MKKLEDVFEKEKVNELVDQESTVDEPPRTGGGTGGTDKGK